jgi:hypothetical protein
MTEPPAGRPFQTDPGGHQARADGRKVEVRTYEGDLVRIVPIAEALKLIENGLADNLKHCVRLKLGIRWLPPRFDRPSRRPDLDQMRRRDPNRYAAVWRGTRDAHIGKGALGRKVVDATVHLQQTKGQR